MLSGRGEKSFSSRDTLSTHVGKGSSEMWHQKMMNAIEIIAERWIQTLSQNCFPFLLNSDNSPHTTKLSSLLFISRCSFFIKFVCLEMFVIRSFFTFLFRLQSNLRPRTAVNSETWCVIKRKSIKIKTH